MMVQAMWGDDPRLADYLGTKACDLYVLDPSLTIRMANGVEKVQPVRIPESWHAALRARLQPVRMEGAA